MTKRDRAFDVARRVLGDLSLATMLAALSAMGLPADGSAQSRRTQPRFVYVGTYTAPNYAPGASEPSLAEGIYVFRMDPRTGDLTRVAVTPANNPSFLALSSATLKLYCVHEEDAGSLSAFAIDPALGTLSHLGSVTSDGSAPTHLSLHPSGRYVMAANYNSGNFPVFRIDARGGLVPTGSFQSLGNGFGAHPFRQDGPHAHQIITDPAGRHVFAVDLGADLINVLDLDLESGRLIPHDVPVASVASGSGPRHMAFHPSLPRAYVLNELASTITVFQYDQDRGAMIWLQTISTLPSRFTGDNTAGEIRAHPSGRFLYSTNRGHESIAMFEVDSETGKLGLLGFQASGGEWPRGMNLDPSGAFLYVANQNTNGIAVFRVQRNGRLQQTALVETPTPVAIEFGAVAGGWDANSQE